MKVRIGFVSNSSSSSFVVLRDGLTKKQERIIENLRKRDFQVICTPRFYVGQNYMDNLNVETQFIKAGLRDDQFHIDRHEEMIDDLLEGYGEEWLLVGKK